MMQRLVAIALAVTLTAWQPCVLVAEYPSGEVVHYAVTNLFVCHLALYDHRTGLVPVRDPDGNTAVTVYCAPGDLFDLAAEKIRSVK